MVRTFDPTAVPKELATSLAPTAKARIKAKIKATTKIHSISVCHSALKFHLKKVGKSNSYLTWSGVEAERTATKHASHTAERSIIQCNRALSDSNISQWREL